MPVLRAATLVVLAALAGAAAPADSPVDVKEPEDLYTGPTQGYTPPTLTGARVVDLPALESLIAQGGAVLIDVSLADHKPAGLPAGTPWMPTHRSIPNALWLPGAGDAPLEPAQEKAFLERVAERAGGDTARPIVTFCRPDCWGSWNAGKRLVRAGYSRVHWFPKGIEGWQDTHETAIVKADAAWTALARDRMAPPGKAQR